MFGSNLDIQGVRNAVLYDAATDRVMHRLHLAELAILFDS